jgi:hypothetical protein
MNSAEQVLSGGALPKDRMVGYIACLPMNNLFLGFRGTEGRLSRQLAHLNVSGICRAAGLRRRDG